MTLAGSMRGSLECHAPEGCFVVIRHGRHAHADDLVGHYISLSQAKQAARHQARTASADTTAAGVEYGVFDEAGQCLYRISPGDLPPALRQPSSAMPQQPLPLRDIQPQAPLGWRNWPAWLSLPILLMLAACDFWCEASFEGGSLHAGNLVLHHWLGAPDFRGLGLVSGALVHLLPLTLWLVLARGGPRRPFLRENTFLLRWVLGGLILGNGFGLMLAVAAAFLLGLDAEADVRPLTALAVAATQLPYFLWLRRQPRQAL